MTIFKAYFEQYTIKVHCECGEVFTMETGSEFCPCGKQFQIGIECVNDGSKAVNAKVLSGLESQITGLKEIVQGLNDDISNRNKEIIGLKKENTTLKQSIVAFEKKEKKDTVQGQKNNKTETKG